MAREKPQDGHVDVYQGEEGAGRCGGRVEQLERNSLLTEALNELAIKAAVKGIRERGARERGDNLLSIWVEFPQA